MTDQLVIANDAGQQLLMGAPEKQLVVGHTVYSSGGRDYVRVTVSCQHGEEDKWYDTNHDDADRISREQRPSIISRAIELHRANLLDEHRVVCNCQEPDDLVIDRDE